MRAVIYDQYGPPGVLRIDQIDKPVARATDVVVKTDYVGLLPYDWRYLRAKPFIVRAAAGWRKPKRKILGMDFAGEVDSVGADVDGFKPGDRVFGLAPRAFAEYVSAGADRVTLIPDGISSLQAATVSASSLTALQGLRDHGALQHGERVLINGASGGVGLFAVQIAKHFGAHVTGVCSQRNTEIVSAAGADRVINYDLNDFTKSDDRYDLILDAAGNHTLAELKTCVTPNGRIVAIIGKLSRLIWLSLPGRRKFVAMVGNPNKPDLETVASLMAQGVIKPNIERIYPIEQVQEAVAHQETMRVRGKLALKINPEA